MYVGRDHYKSMGSDLMGMDMKGRDLVAQTILKEDHFPQLEANRV